MSEGECYLCGENYTKQGMSRHVEACKKENFELEGKGNSLHLRVNSGRFWLNLGINSKAKLKDLDQFFRDIWLECCGHLSRFKIDRKIYSCPRSQGFGEKSMDIELVKVLTVGEKFTYWYDFGSTTELSLKAISSWKGKAKDKIIILARNNRPMELCQCGNKATLVCSGHAFIQKGLLCDKCASHHGCDEELLMPIVNSPRFGICGYIGSDKDTKQSSSGGVVLVCD